MSKANDPFPVLFCFLDLSVELDLTKVLLFLLLKWPQVSVGFVSTISCGHASLNLTFPGPSYCLG